MVSQAHLCYQRAEYDRAVDLVPALMAGVCDRSASAAGEWRRAAATAAAAHLVVSKLALKFGDAPLAWLAADRALARATEADAAALRAVAQFAIGFALLAMPGRERDAADLTEHALTAMMRHHQRTSVEISALGALRLLAAQVAARQQQHSEVHAHLRAARALAERLGEDRNDLWTGFGATNVLIHQLGIDAYGEPDRAIAVGEQLDTSRLPSALVSRRCQIHLDLAAAFAHRLDGDPSAVLHLLQAEQLAPQLIQVHPPARALVQCLLGRERRAATPGLRELACRVGVAE